MFSLGRKMKWPDLVPCAIHGGDKNETQIRQAEVKSLTNCLKAEARQCLGVLCISLRDLDDFSNETHESLDVSATKSVILRKSNA